MTTDQYIIETMNKILNESKVGTYVEEQLTKTHEAKLKDFKVIEEQLKKDQRLQLLLT